MIILIAPPTYHKQMGKKKRKCRSPFTLHKKRNWFRKNLEKNPWKFATKDSDKPIFLKDLSLNTDFNKFQTFIVDEKQNEADNNDSVMYVHSFELKQSLFK